MIRRYGRDIYRIFLSDGITLTAMVDPNHDWEAWVWGEGPEPLREAERLWELERRLEDGHEDNAIEIEYEEGRKFVRVPITPRDLFYNLMGGYTPLPGPPQIYDVGSMRELVERAASGD